jgi:HSP20 family protein
VTFGRDPDRLRNEMEDLFADLWQGRRLVGPRRAFRPAVDVSRTEDPPVVTIVCDLAGVDPGDIELSVASGILSITGSRRRPATEQAVYHQIELDYGPFERHVPIGEEVDPGGAEASYDRGLLTVRLPLLAREPQAVKVLIAVVRQR